MLRITLEDYVRRSQEDPAPTHMLKLEGKLMGPWVEELERVWGVVTKEHAAQHVVIDLCEILFVDAEGKKLIQRMYQQGARLEASGCVMNSFIEEIKWGSKRCR